MKREKFSSRLGFIMISAGCAVGLGNVWRFPYITGQYGGAAFVLLYLVFLIMLGLPIMVMEFAVGRASQKSAAVSFDHLQPKGTKWHWIKYVAISGNYLLMMFYTTIGGWMLAYFFKTAKGDFAGMDMNGISSAFNDILADGGQLLFWMFVVVIIGFLVCSKGLQNGVEKVSKYMMSALFIIMIALTIRAITLPGAIEGLKFYLIPDFGKMMEMGIMNVIFAAMSQAFFTLSLGIGALAIFGSYIGKERSLTGESISVMLLDTLVAIISGLIIFPACFSYGVDANSGPGLVFVTLPNIFNEMPMGQLWGSLFFLFMACAALTTIIAIFQNILSFMTDLTGCSRKKAIGVNFIVITLVSIPCALGFNVWNNIQPLGLGTTIQDLEDFIVSSNLLPLGSLLYLMFCTSRYGWGWDSFIEEANTGKGIKFPRKAYLYVSYILPIIVIFIFFQGYLEKFSAPLNFILPTIIIAFVFSIPYLSRRSKRQK